MPLLFFRVLYPKTLQSLGYSYCGLCKSLVRFMRSFPLHNLRIIKRRFVQEIDDHSVVALKNFKETQAGVLVLARESKKEGVRGFRVCTWSCQ